MIACASAIYLQTTLPFMKAWCKPPWQKCMIITSNISFISSLKVSTMLMSLLVLGCGTNTEYVCCNGNSNVCTIDLILHVTLPATLLVTMQPLATLTTSHPTSKDTSKTFLLALATARSSIGSTKASHCVAPDAPTAIQILDKFQNFR